MSSLLEVPRHPPNHTYPSRVRRYLVPDLHAESDEDQKRHQDNPSAATCPPEVPLVLAAIDDTLQVHAEVRREEREGKEDDCHAGEKQDSFVLAVGDDGEFVLLYGAELEELGAYATD